MSYIRTHAHMHTCTHAWRLWRARIGTSLAGLVLASSLLSVDSSPASAAGDRPAGGCGQSYNPTIPGGEAHWDLSCGGGMITVSGWVRDTDADGQCAAVKATFAGGQTEVSRRACPEGDRQTFSWTHPGAIADVYLYAFGV